MEILVLTKIHNKVIFRKYHKEGEGMQQREN